MNAQTVKVMTYNLHSAVGMDKLRDTGRISALIKAQNPDLCGLQEVLRKYRPEPVDMPRELEDGTEMKIYFGAALSRNTDGVHLDYGIASLSKPDSELAEIIMLPWEHGCEPRAAVVLKIRHPAGDFYFINTHLSYENDLDDERLEQLQKILAVMREKNYLPAIITGDFNAEPDSPCIRLLEENCTVVNHGTRTFSTYDPLVQIDYIAYTPRNAFSVLNMQVIPEKTASDHFPVCATLIPHFGR